MSHLSDNPEEKIIFYTRQSYFSESDIESTLEAIAPYFPTKEDAEVSLNILLDRFIEGKLNQKLFPYLPTTPHYSIAKLKWNLHQILDPIKGEQEKANAIARMGGADGARAIVALLELED